MVQTKGALLEQSSLNTFRYAPGAKIIFELCYSPENRVVSSYVQGKCKDALGYCIKFMFMALVIGLTILLINTFSQRLQAQMHLRLTSRHVSAPTLK